MNYGTTQRHKGTKCNCELLHRAESTESAENCVRFFSVASVASVRPRSASWLGVFVCTLLFATSCATTTTFEPLPDPQSSWNRTGYEKARLSVVALVVESGGDGDAFGAGIVYDDRGHILTAHHVVENATRILVLVSGGYTVRASVVGADPISDFAILRADAVIPDKMRPADFATGAPVPGEPVWNLGNPFGTSRFGGEASVGHGVVSAINRTYLNDDTGRLYLDGIQHDAPTNPGNSGGGIFNERGELLGLNALITTTRETPSDSGVAFAVPAYALKQMAEDLLAGRAPQHGWFGAENYKQATEIYPQGYGRLRAVFGPLNPAGPAQFAGIQPGDVVIKVDDTEVYGIHELLMLEDSIPPGQQVEITINRAGREFAITLTAASRPWPWG